MNATGRRPIVCLVLLSFLLLPGCVATLLQFIVPPTVRTSTTFEVVVIANNTGGSSGEALGAVLQLPAGFSVLGAATPNQELGNPIPVQQNAPGFSGMYVPESGHSLAYFSGTISSTVTNPIVLRVRLLAPSAPGTYTLKIALAGISGGTWQAQDPAGVTDFSLISGPAHAMQTVVIAVPAPSLVSWTENVLGLPNYDYGNWCGAAFGDVNGDGRQDLACIARLGNGPHVLVNASPTGWSDVSSGLQGGSGRSDVAFGDFNGDHLLDLADGNGKCFLGNGGTSWTNASIGINASFGAEGVAVGDVNGDGFDDVAFSGHFSPLLKFFFSLGNGTWVESSAGLPTTQPPSAAVAGGHKLFMRDVNGDGFLDLVWARIQAPGIWLGNGAGSWTEVVNSGLEPYQFWGVDAADFDGDGDTDLVLGAFNDPSNPSFPLGVRLYRQQPGPIWIHDPNSGLPTSGGYMDVAVADFDRDGILDIVAGRVGGVNGGIEIWQGQPGGTFAAAPFSAGLPANWITNAEGIAVGDIDDDTFPEIAAACYGLGVFVFRNQMTGFSLYGQGCQGSSQYQPSIGSSGGPPNIGNAGFTWTLSGAAPNAAASLLLGGSKTYFGLVPALPLPLANFGAPGCFLLADPVFILPFGANASGFAAFNTPIPYDPTLVHLTVFGQWVVLDTGANPLGVTLSQGAALRVGP